MVSLFTNVPLTETIEIIAEKFFSKSSGDTPPIRKNIFIKLMYLATEGFFTFNDKLYKQINGVAMGSPLGTTLANFFLGNLENSVFEHSSPSHSKIYIRYVDDVFAIFDDNPAVDSFLNVFNNLHNKLNSP